MNNILITGGSGFIGSHVAELLLSQGKNIVNIDNFDDFYDYGIKIRNTLDSLKLDEFPINKEYKRSNLIHLTHIVNRDNYKLYTSDIRHLDEIRRVFEENKIDCIIHLAAKAGVRPSIENPVSYAETNITGTINILELAKEFKVKKVILASSSSVYGNNLKVPFGEADKLDCIISQYAATKKAMEDIAHVYHSLYGLDMILLRFFTVYGPRQRPDLAIHKFTNLIYKEQAIPFYGDGSTSRDYTYIDDIINGIIGALKYLTDNNKVYEIINLGESTPISLSCLVNSLELIIGKKAKLSIQKQQSGDVNTTFADISKARNLLKYNPKFDFNSGIFSFITWYKKTNNI